MTKVLVLTLLDFVSFGYDYMSTALGIVGFHRKYSRGRTR